MRDQRGLAVVAYGKIGGIALGYGSGLVFLHGGNPDIDKDGHKPIDSRPFYLRL
ncbi:hypothetical protein L3V47_03145 [Aeromonas salmonicida]|nr:hypothetical protein [Aeromonas salmonicida]WFC14762.1 hypothetical protein L3V47_03145 [Aeromonas salmonicida]